MRNREHECFSSVDFHVMRFLDPRLKELLKREEKEEALKSLFQADCRLFGGKGDDSEGSNVASVIARKVNFYISPPIDFFIFIFNPAYFSSSLPFTIQSGPRCCTRPPILILGFVMGSIVCTLFVLNCTNLHLFEECMGQLGGVDEQ